MKSKFWGYRIPERGVPQFVMLANKNNSSSCRQFDARSGARIDYNTSGGGGNYDSAYGSIFRECRELIAPPGVTTSELTGGLPSRYLNFLQEQVGIEPTASVVSSLPSAERGMLGGTRELIQAALGLDVAFDTVTAAQRLSASPVLLDSAGLLDRLYERILRNWDRSECRSTQLWRSVGMPGIAERNASPEKTLEKAIVEWAHDWFNQIPAAAGLLRDVEEKHRNVDLGHFVTSGYLELIELKAGPNADTPLKAAFEIALYALLYCFARTHGYQLGLSRGNRVLDAKRVDLKVLAPREVYAGYRLEWLQKSLDAGFKQFSRRRFTGALEMSFRFESFPPDFQWPGTSAYELPKFLERRMPVVWQ
jgi:hypothetical protein